MITPLHFYKPNSRNAGIAIGFRPGPQCLFVEMIKQFSWSGGKGNFKGNKKSPGTQFFAKITQKEMGAILNLIDYGAPYKLVHEKCSGEFKQYLKNEQVVGIIFSFYSKQEDGQSINFSVALDLNEARLLKSYVETVLSSSFFYDDSQENNDNQPNNQDDVQPVDNQQDNQEYQQSYVQETTDEKVEF